MVRIGLKQKNAMLLLHFIELKFGVHTPAKTSYLKRKIEEQLDSSDAKANENMWQLTPKGRQYAKHCIPHHSAQSAGMSKNKCGCVFASSSYSL